MPTSRKSDGQPRGRRAVASFSLFIVTVFIGGCTFITPQSTKGMPASTAGLNFHVGEIAVGDIVIISNDGKRGSLVATVVNFGDVEHELTVLDDVSGSVLTISLVPHAFTQLGRPGGVIEVIAIDQVPGSIHLLSFSDETGAVHRVEIPILTDSLPQFAGLAPSDLDDGAPN